MKDVISFLNNYTSNISHFEEMEHGLLIHMKNGDTIEFYTESAILAHHYKGDEEEMNEPQEGLLLLQNKVEYLKDTIGILVNYDNENTVEGLKALIDETRKRLEKILNSEVKDEDLSITEEQFNERK